MRWLLAVPFSWALLYVFNFGAQTDENFGGTLAGDRPRNSLYDIRFREPKQPVEYLCQITLNQNQIKQFRTAIKEHYVFEMFIDELPLHGFVGEIEQSTEEFEGGHKHSEVKYYLYPHLDFSIAFHEHNVIAVNLTTDVRKRVLLEFGDDLSVDFTYTVSWEPTRVKFVDRMSLHNPSLVGAQNLEIHWLSILNSCVLVVLLVAFSSVALIRVVKKDLARYMMDIEDEDQEEESGWKLVHGQVFRFPKFPMLFSAFIGTGAQMLALAVSMLVLAMVGTFYPGENRGGLYSASVFLYAVTAAIAGYVSTSLYISFGGQKWATNSVLTALVFAVPLLCVFAVTNSIAIYYG